MTVFSFANQSRNFMIEELNHNVNTKAQRRANAIKILPAISREISDYLNQRRCSSAFGPSFISENPKCYMKCLTEMRFWRIIDD